MRNSLILGLVVLLCLVGCKPPRGRVAAIAKVGRGSEPEMAEKRSVSDEELKRLIERLKSDEESISKEANEELSKLRNTEIRLEPIQGILLLRAAGDKFPKKSEWDDRAGDLVSLVAEYPNPEYV